MRMGDRPDDILTLFNIMSAKTKIRKKFLLRIYSIQNQA